MAPIDLWVALWVAFRAGGDALKGYCCGTRPAAEDPISRHIAQRNLDGDLGVPGPASAAPGPRNEVRHAEVIAVFGLDALQVDLGTMTAAVALEGAGAMARAI